MNPNVDAEPAADASNGAAITVLIDQMVKNATTFLEEYRVTVTAAVSKASNGAYTANDFVSDTVRLWALAFQALPRPEPAPSKDPP